MSTGAIFLDRDGTINECAPPHEHITHSDDFQFLPRALPALAFLAKNSGRKIALVTNQSCIGRGTATWKDVNALHAWMEKRIAKAGGRLDGIYICPHRPDEGCTCRKPQPGLLTLAAMDLDLDLSQSCLVGDVHTDLQAAWAAGVPECYLLLGRDTTFPRTGQYTIYASLYDAAQAIVRGERNT